MRKIYVLAGSIEQYHSFLDIMQLKPCECKYITILEQIAGMYPLKVFFYGTWYKKDAIMVAHIREIATEIYEIQTIKF
jgi:hypothetical protein